MKTQNKKITLVLLVLTTFFFSCSKDENTIEPETIVEPTVYIVGGDTMWKSEQGADFTETVFDNDAQLKDIFLEGDDVYIGGYKIVDNSTRARSAQIWKNGEVIHSEDRGETSDISNIFVQNGDVYAVGRFFDGGSGIPTLWKNGIAIELGRTLFYVRDIYVNGLDVYIVGVDKDTGKPVLLKNGVVTPLSEHGSLYMSIFGKDNDVYITLDNKYLKNGEEHTLTVPTRFGAYARSIYVDGDDVYVAGMMSSSGTYIATVWKNGEPTNLTDSTQNAAATDVIVHNGDVYICGSEENGTGKSYAILWKNGERINLTDGERNDAAYALAIK